MAGIRIKDIDIYHPDKRIGNDFSYSILTTKVLISVDCWLL